MGGGEKEESNMEIYENEDTLENIMIILISVPMKSISIK